VAAGRWHSLALRADGSLVAWGDNAYGQTALPPGLNKAVAVAAGGNHSLALRPNGTIVAWGDNCDADGRFVGQSRVPTGLNGVQAIGAGDYHSLAVRTNGTVIAWGDDSQGQCEVPANLKAVTVVGGGTHTIAVKADSTTVAWGNNWNGQCNYPTNMLDIAAVAVGESHSVFLVGLSQPKLFRAAHTAGQFNLCVPTYPGKNYALEYKTSFDAAAWTPTPPIRGNGGLLILTDPAATNAPRFYRVEVW
jgi:alpha-tubulin suppressor-like RCC1 family protein